jgi:molybdate transport system substrate-binding protein
MRRALAVAALLALTLGACGDDDDDSGSSSSDSKPRLVVSAASSMTEALSDCSAGFAGASVRLSFAGSDELAAQIRQGVKPDVYAAANTKLPDELYADGLLQQPVKFATNTFVLAVPKGSDIKSLDDLTEKGVKIAIGSEDVPIGSYTRESLSKLPPAQEKAILANVRSSEPDVKGIVGKLTQGAVDAGFVYVTDVNATNGELEAIELPAAVQPEVTYDAAVVKGAKQPDEAEIYLDGLAGGPCADALKEAGFGPPPS